MAQQWNPLQDLMVLQDRMNRLFEDATQRRANTDAETSLNARLDARGRHLRTESGYAIAIDLPGLVVMRWRSTSTTTG
jgi:hypothetical protein